MDGKRLKQLLAPALSWVLVCTLAGGSWQGAHAAELPDSGDLALRTEEMRSIPFDDVPLGSPGADAVRYAACRGVLRGTAPNTFSPDVLARRGLALGVLYRLHRAEGDAAGEAQIERTALSSGEGTGGPDGPSAQDTPLEWAVSTGICQGSAAGIQADGLLTRAQWAAVRDRDAVYAGCDVSCSGDLSAYPDASAAPGYARLPLSWVLERGIFAPLVRDEIHPQLALSRAQVAQTETTFLADTGDDPLAAQSVYVLPEAAPSLSRAKHQQIQAAVDAAAARYGAAGIEVAVVEDGRVTDTYAWGWATKGQDPMTADHKLRVASISKVAVGMGAQLLREQGTIDLDAPIGTYWGAPVKNPYYPDVPVTIRQILSHTSSIAAFGDEVSRSYGPVRSALTSGQGFTDSAPGASWEYNNYAFGVLGMTLELAAGRTMDAVLKESLFRPMDIDGGFCAGDIRGTGKLATIYRHDGSVGRSAEYQRTIHGGAPGDTGTYFAGGLTISARDLGKLASLLANDGNYEGLQLLRPESVALMESHGAGDAGGFYQCLPLRYQAGMYGRQGIFYHTGSAYGVYNCFSYDPVERDGVVVLTTGAGADYDRWGVYAVCGDIAQAVYSATASGDSR